MTLVKNPKSKLIPQLGGVHLFGFDAAPCSQRVSFALAEKGLFRTGKVPFLSDVPADLDAPTGTYLFRHVSLPKHDNITEEYAEIQPNLVVPALVHDGQLHIESMDIIQYLDRAWPENPLVPDDPASAGLCRELVDLGKDLHVAVRYVSFNWGYGKMAKTDAETEAVLQRLEREGSPEQLTEFYTQFNKDAIAEETFLMHLRDLEEGYQAQETRLLSDGRQYLVGSTFSIADIIWAIKVLRLTECGYPFKQRFPALSAWYSRIQSRPGFKDGVMANNRLLHRVFRLKAGLANVLGNGIGRQAQGVQPMGEQQ
jgi:glutathione S-transferase